MGPRSTSLRGGAATADQVAVRRHNLAVVLGHLRRHGARSRARVAAETGLNKATVSSLVAELLGRGLVTEGETERGGVGRPGQVIEVDATHYFALGAEINIDFLSVVVMNLRGEVAVERRVALDTAHMEPAQVLRRLVRTVTSLMTRMDAQGSRALGMTVVVPGIVESATGRLLEAVNLGWHDEPVGDDVRRMLGDPDFPIFWDNEATLAALAELEERDGTGTEEVLLLTGGVGVGGGIVSHGQLVRGARGFAGELGHMQVDREGPPCGCGRLGCWETMVGLSALLRLATEEGDPVRDPNVDVVDRLEELRQRAEDGDERTLRAMESIAEWMVSGTATLVNIFNPQVLVLGGYFAVLGPWLVPALEEGLVAQVHAPDAGGCRIELSTLGFSAAVRGAAHHAVGTVLDDPTVVPMLESLPTVTTGATP